MLTEDNFSGKESCEDSGTFDIMTQFFNISTSETEMVLLGAYAS